MELAYWPEYEWHVFFTWSCWIVSQKSPNFTCIFSFYLVYFNHHINHSNKVITVFHSSFFSGQFLIFSDVIDPQVPETSSWRSSQNQTQMMLQLLLSLRTPNSPRLMLKRFKHPVELETASCCFLKHYSSNKVPTKQFSHGRHRFPKLAIFYQGSDLWGQQAPDTL